MAGKNQTVTTYSTWYYSHKNDNNNTWYTVRTDQFPQILTFYDSNLTASVSTPNFRKLVWKPWNPYTKIDNFVSDPPGTFTLNTKKWIAVAPPSPEAPGYFALSTLNYENINAVTLGASSTSTPEMLCDDPTQKVISKLQAEIRLGHANLGTTLAESGKTADHIAKTANRLYNGLKAIKRFDLAALGSALGVSISKRQHKRFRRRAKSAGFYDPSRKYWKVPRDKYRSDFMDFTAKTWLEYSYAWKPLINDTYAFAKASAEIAIARSNNVRTVEAKSRDSRSFTGKKTINSIGIGDQKSVNSSIRVSMKLWYTIDDGGASLTTAFGLNNPLAVVWEVIPFSFVVDWFLPVGNYLEALTAYKGLTLTGGTKTTIVETSTVHTISGGNTVPWDGSGTMSSVGGLTLNARYFSMSRTGIGSFPTLSFPSFKDPRSFAHAASAIALLKTIFSKSS